MDPDSPSLDFTKVGINKIYSKTSTTLQQKYFLLAILSFLGLIALGITGFLLFQIIATAKPIETNEIVSTYSKSIGDYFLSLFGKKNLTIFGSLLSFAMLVSGYFLFEFQKRSKKKLVTK